MFLYGIIFHKTFQNHKINEYIEKEIGDYTEEMRYHEKFKETPGEGE
jgi:hypothetical protein